MEGGTDSTAADDEPSRNDGNGDGWDDEDWGSLEETSPQVGHIWSIYFTFVGLFATIESD